MASGASPLPSVKPPELTTLHIVRVNAKGGGKFYTEFEPSAEHRSLTKRQKYSHVLPISFLSNLIGSFVFWLLDFGVNCS